MEVDPTPRDAGTKKRGRLPPCASVAVGDVPAAPGAALAVVVLLAGVDGCPALLVGVEGPTLGAVAGVAGGPDQVGFVDGHRVSCG